MANKGNQRRVSGNIPIPYDRQQPFAEHPAPGPSVPYAPPFLNRFGPGPEEPPAPGFREGYPNEFPPGPNFWGPDREFFPPATQSPDRFRPPQPDGWQHPPTWKEPEAAGPPWPERRNNHNTFNRPPRDNTATRMFEPSDNWKQTHGERTRGRNYHSMSQPQAERFRPYSSLPNGNANRNRFPQANQRSDPYRPPFNDADTWVADETPYEGISRDYQAAIAARSTTPDRLEKRTRSVEGEGTSVSPGPVSPPIFQSSASPGFGSASAFTKRESPELPHLEALPPKPMPPVRVPPAPKFHSRSPSHSSTSSSIHLPYPQPQISPRAGLPPKPQFLPQARLPIPHTQPPPYVQNLSVPQLPPEPRNGIPIPLDVPPPPPAAPPVPIQQKQDEARSAPSSNGRNNGRRSILHNAPAFVPSTLAIDAPLMYPTGVASADTSKTQPQPAKAPDHDVTGSDMDVSLPPTPAKVIHEEAETESIRSSKSPRPDDPVADSHQGPKAPVKGPIDDDATSDMDMSPPPSPLLKPASGSGAKTPKDLTVPKTESFRPSLAIDISASQLPHELPHEIARQSSSASPVPTTPEAVEETAGEDNDSDMDMSSPTSETAPSPPAQTSSAPESEELVATPPPGSVSTALVKETPSSPRTTHPKPDAVDVLLPPSSSAEGTAANTPDPHPSTPLPAASREVSVQVSPRLTAVAKLPRPHVETGELSPPASDRTLQGEPEGTDQDQDTIAKVRVSKETGVQQEVPMDVDRPHADKVYAEIPLSDALRMVAKLRFRHDPVTQDARVEPILFSNRQVAEQPQTPGEAPAPAPGIVAQTVAEKQQHSLSDGYNDGTKHSLRKRFAQHQVALAEKVQRLRKEYLALHEKWMNHCAKLDEVARNSALEEAAATACRTTRRTAAMGDAVRTDLEMEQILASLGNEELTDANHLSAKNAAVIPDMMSVKKAHLEYMYDDTNNLVEDPHEFYKLETGIDDWTDDEKATFVEKYVVYPKQFGIIAEFLPHKTPAQCVTFYYLHKNTTIDFRKVIAQYNTIGKRRRSGRGKQKGNALLADILKHDDEVGRDGTPTSGRRKRGHTGPSTPVPSTSNESVDKRATSSRRGTAQNTPDPTPTPDPEPGPSGKRPRRRANPSAKAAAAMEQDNPEETVDDDTRPAKRTRKARKSKAEVDDTDDGPGTQAETKPLEQLEQPVRKKVPGSGSSWSAEDKALFLKLLAQYGDDFKRIASSMPNKTTVQVSAFYRANLTEMQLAKVAALAPKRSPTPQESNKHNTITIPGTGLMNTVMKRTIPGVENGAAPTAASRSRNSGRMSPPPNPSGTQSSETDQRPTSAVQRDATASLKPSVPSRPLQYQGGLAAAFAGPSRSTLAEGRPTLTLGRPPATIAAIAYPPMQSLPNFTGAVRDSYRHNALTRDLPGINGTMEFSDFAPQPWQVARPGHMHPSAAAMGLPPTGGGAPTALETTDDLVRYLEHRTQLVAKQNQQAQDSDSGFM